MSAMGVLVVGAQRGDTASVLARAAPWVRMSAAPGRGLGAGPTDSTTTTSGLAAVSDVNSAACHGCAVGSRTTTTSGRSPAASGRRDGRRRPPSRRIDGRRRRRGRLMARRAPRHVEAGHAGRRPQLDDVAGPEAARELAVDAQRLGGRRRLPTRSTVAAAGTDRRRRSPQLAPRRRATRLGSSRASSRSRRRSPSDASSITVSSCPAPEAQEVGAGRQSASTARDAIEPRRRPRPPCRARR